MRERLDTVDRKKELEAKANKFLDLLYKYDYEGKDAYFRHHENGDLFVKNKPLFTREESYNVIVGRSYVWIDAPYLRLGITKEGELFLPKNYWSFGRPYGLNIDAFLDPELWGSVINREHTQARRGIGRYESVVMDYHDIVFRKK